MPRPKGNQNKITTEVKNKLQGVMDDVVSTLDRQTNFIFVFSNHLCSA